MAEDPPLQPVPTATLTNETPCPIVQPEMAKTKDPARMGRPIELTGPLGELAECIGTVELLAKSVGVTARTLRRYHRGEQNPPMPVRLVLHALARTHKVEPPFSIVDLSAPKWLATRRDAGDDE